MSRSLLLAIVVTAALGVVGFFGLAGDFSAAARLAFWVLAVVVVVLAVLGRTRRG